MSRARVVCMVVVILCCLPWQAVQARGDIRLTIFAASSLTDAFENIAAAFEEDYPDIDVVLNFASSSTLATQLAEGAPADVFASANAKQMSIAQDAGRIAGHAVTFAGNRLVVIVPADNPANIQSLDDLANGGVLLVVAAPEVPVRAYTDTMLEGLAATDGYGDAYRSAVLANIVSEEANVRQVVAKVALGEADAGVVYLSDVTPDISAQVATIAISDVCNTIATYPIAITNDTAHPAQARLFVDFVISGTGQDILTRWGFVPVDSPEHTGMIAPGSSPHPDDDTPCLEERHPRP